MKQKSRENGIPIPPKITYILLIFTAKNFTFFGVFTRLYVPFVFSFLKHDSFQSIPKISFLVRCAFYNRTLFFINISKFNIEQLFNNMSKITEKYIFAVNTVQSSFSIENSRNDFHYIRAVHHFIVQVKWRFPFSLNINEEFGKFHLTVNKFLF